MNIFQFYPPSANILSNGRTRMHRGGVAFRTISIPRFAFFKFCRLQGFRLVKYHLNLSIHVLQPQSVPVISILEAALRTLLVPNYLQLSFVSVILDSLATGQHAPKSTIEHASTITAAVLPMQHAHSRHQHQYRAHAMLVIEGVAMFVIQSTIVSSTTVAAEAIRYAPALDPVKTTALVATPGIFLLLEMAPIAALSHVSLAPIRAE